MDDVADEAALYLHLTDELASFGTERAEAAVQIMFIYVAAVRAFGQDEADRRSRDADLDAPTTAERLERYRAALLGDVPLTG